MAIDQPFAPLGATVNVTAGTTTATTALTDLGYGSQTTRVYNAGAVAVFLRFGTAATTSTLAAGMPIAPGAFEVFNTGGATHMATITASSTAAFYATPGIG